MESEVVVISESDESNPILSYQWKCIKSRIQYESELKAIQRSSNETTSGIHEKQTNDQVLSLPKEEIPTESSNPHSVIQNQNPNTTLPSIPLSEPQEVDNDYDDFF